MDRQPPLGIINGVLVFLSGFQGVFNGCLRPDLTGREVDAAADVDWVAFEDAGQLLEVDGQGSQHRRWTAAELSIELVGEVIVPDPASLRERNTEPVSEFGRPSTHCMTAAIRPSPASCSASS